MKLTPGQSTRVRTEVNHYSSSVASRGVDHHNAAESLMEALLEIASESKCVAGPSDVACGAIVAGAQCTDRASLILHGRARCYEHRAVQ